MTPEALRRRMAHGNIYAAEKVDAALGNYFRVGNLGRAARAGAAVGGRPGRRGAAGLPRRPRHRRRLGDPGAGRRRRHRRPGRRPAHPPGGPHRRRGPRASCSACTCVPTTACAGQRRRRWRDHRAPARGPRRHYHEVVGDDVAEALVRLRPGRAAPPSSCSAPAAGRGWPELHRGSVINAVLRAAGGARRPRHLDQRGRRRGAPAAPAGPARPTPLPRRRQLAGWLLGRRRPPAAHRRPRPAPRRHRLSTSAAPATCCVVVAVAAVGGCWPGVAGRRRRLPAR